MAQALLMILDSPLNKAGKVKVMMNATAIKLDHSHHLFRQFMCTPTKTC